MAKTGTRGLSSRIIRVSYPLSLNLHILGPAYSRYAHWGKEREGKGKWERKEGKRGGRVRERQTVCLSTLPCGSQQRKQIIALLRAQSS